LARLKAQKLAYVYFEEPGRRSAAKLLTKDEARRIAAKYRRAAGAVAENVSPKACPDISLRCE